ncbi:hypothetical protein ANAPC5_01177 [Anaplasma phagocytophilum]|nr:hypothetical protein ANAPC5_01177 [Anaplasma phagocytophilum]
MMLLLDRLITLLLLLPRLPGRTSFSLPMLLLEFLTLISVRRFVRRRGSRIAEATTMLRMGRRLKTSAPAATKRRWLFVGQQRRMVTTQTRAGLLLRRC